MAWLNETAFLTITVGTILFLWGYITTNNLLQIIGFVLGILGGWQRLRSARKIEEKRTITKEDMIEKAVQKRVPFFYLRKMNPLFYYLLVFGVDSLAFILTTGLFVLSFALSGFIRNYEIAYTIFGIGTILGLYSTYKVHKMIFTR